MAIAYKESITLLYQHLETRVKLNWILNRYHPINYYNFLQSILAALLFA